jgi:hypothetical protein
MTSLQNKVVELFENGTINLMIGFKLANKKFPVPFSSTMLRKLNS